MKLINLEDVKYEVFFDDDEFKNYVSEEALNEMSVIDAEPVKRGEWVDDFTIYKYVNPDEITVYKRCSNCGYNGVFVDDHSRYMGHSDIEERQKLFDILCEAVKRTGNWDKVTILNGNYYENFMDVVNYVKEVMNA